MNGLLLVHYITGILAVAVAALLVWRRPGRRAMLYLLTVQIALGIALIVSHLRAPSAHYACALLAWIGYMAANAVGRRPGRAPAGLAITVLSSVLVLAAFAIGLRYAPHIG